MMNLRRVSKLAAAGAATAFALASAPALAELSPEELAKLAQNPIGNMVSVPFQNQTNFNVGPLNGTQNVLNIQPVIPFEVHKDWNLVTRWIFPLIWQPGFVPGEGRTFGLGDMQVSGFLSPSEPTADGIIWGAGAIVQAPTDTQELGNKNWGLGPTAVVLRMKHGDPWMYGVLVNNVWSVSSSQRGGSYSNFLAQPFLSYNFPGGTYIATSPIITANWKADGGQQWTVPLGVNVGHIFHIGRLPVNAQLDGYYNVVHPDYGPNWQLRVQVQLMFPK